MFFFLYKFSINSKQRYHFDIIKTNNKNKLKEIVKSYFNLIQFQKDKFEEKTFYYDYNRKKYIKRIKKIVLEFTMFLFIFVWELILNYII